MDGIKEILFVNEDPNDELQERLNSNRMIVIHARDGKEAITRISRRHFAAILVGGTGAEIDMIETLLNIRDIREMVPIAILKFNNESNEEKEKKEGVASHFPMSLRDAPAHRPRAIFGRLESV
ncbi:MAG: hypothetical protein SVY10_08445, partial [Thermodesulfobacteriota bacterium]|nr:hypothetical protein [Thermodesulfobacteriota bacterium]